MAVIGITGRAQHGKDTVGQLLSRTYGYHRYAFADQLKAMALKVDPLVGPDAIIQPVRLSQLVEEQGWEEAKLMPEVRRFLQQLGSEARNFLGDDVWVRAMHRQLIKDDALDLDIVITDVRFPNEAAYVIEELGGELWRVVRVNEETGVNAAGQQFCDLTPFDNGVDPEHPSEMYVESLPASKEFVAKDVKHLERAVNQYVLYREVAGKLGVSV